MKGLPQNEFNLTVFDITAEEGNQLLAQINGEDIPKLPDDALLEKPSGLQHLEKIKTVFDSYGKTLERKYFDPKIKN